MAGGASEAQQSSQVEPDEQDELDEPNRGSLTRPQVSSASGEGRQDLDETGDPGCKGVLVWGFDEVPRSLAACSDLCQKLEIRDRGEVAGKAHLH